MYFTVRFSLATKTFSMNRIQIMYHILHLQVTMLNIKIKSENTEKEINPRIIF